MRLLIRIETQEEKRGFLLCKYASDNIFVMLKTSQITVEILLICYAALSLGALLPRSPTPVLDQIVFGHPVSEAAHDFSGPGTVLGSTNTLPLRYPLIIYQD